MFTLLWAQSYNRHLQVHRRWNAGRGRFEECAEGILPHPNVRRLPLPLAFSVLSHSLSLSHLAPPTLSHLEAVQVYRSRQRAGPTPGMTRMRMSQRFCRGHHMDIIIAALWYIDAASFQKGLKSTFFEAAARKCHFYTLIPVQGYFYLIISPLSCLAIHDKHKCASMSLWLLTDLISQG